MMKVHWRHLIFVALSFLAGIGVSTYGYSFLLEKKDATGIIVTVFSILAGFLIAIMTLLGDQSVLPGSWRIAENKQKSIRAKLIQQKWLFYLYLVTLSIIFVATIIGKTEWPRLVEWLERTYFGLATAAFLVSFRLPAILMDVQLERVEAVIGARNRQSSKLDQ
jgi:hypothetical protein